MKDTHHHSLIRYLNDIVAMERDMLNAVRTQLEDDRVKGHPELKGLFLDLAVHGDHRADMFEKLVEKEGGTIGGVIKEGIASLTGILAGLYGIARQHPLSHMVRDNTVAMNMASASYGMLLTVAMALGHRRCEELALSALDDCPKFIMRLSDLLPRVIVEELTGDATVPYPSAATEARELMRRAWRNAGS